jgi:hypothetical protein
MLSTTNMKRFGKGLVSHPFRFPCFDTTGRHDLVFVRMSLAPGLSAQNLFSVAAIASV